MQLVTQRVADALDPRQFLLRRELHDVPRVAFHDLRSHLVSTGFERVLPLQFQQEGDSVQDLGSSFTGHAQTMGRRTEFATAQSKKLRPVQTMPGSINIPTAAGSQPSSSGS